MKLLRVDYEWGNEDCEVFIAGVKRVKWDSLKLTISFQEAHLFFGILFEIRSDPYHTVIPFGWTITIFNPKLNHFYVL